MNENALWDQTAPDYQRVFRLGLNDYNVSLLHFWQDGGMLFPGALVLDIGCGVGKYGCCLAEMGYDVTLTDISGEMLRHAEANLARYNTPWAVYRCDFNEVTGSEPVFADGFDLAISTMSPAIHDAETVRKMSSMSRGWCFLARFYDWKQPFRDRLMDELGIKPRYLFNDLKADCASMTQAVCAAGFVPQVKYIEYNWSDLRTPEQMADYMARNYYSEDQDRDKLCEKTLMLCKAFENNEGPLEDMVNTKVAWIYWKTGQHFNLRDQLQTAKKF